MDSRRWEEMEIDCLLQIFMRLGLDDLTLTIPFVCKSWLTAVFQPQCWRKLDFMQIDLLPWSSFSKKFSTKYSLPYFSFSHFLRFSVKRSCNSVTELRFPLKFTSLQDLVFASNECPNLEALALPILSPADEVQIPKLMSRWKHLERLELASKPSVFAELVKSISKECRGFSGLAVSGSIRKEDAAAIARHLPKIKCLDLSKSYLTKEALLQILSGCKDLERLNVNDCIGFVEEDAEILCKASDIEVFSNKGCKLYYEHVDDSDDRGNGFYFLGYIV